MAAAKRSKGNAGRKVKDKWKAKEWYNVHAPKMFNEMVIGETPAADPELLIGRTAEVTVQDITGDFSKMHIKLKFKITGTDGHEAKTAFIGHDLTSDYVRRLTRRKKTKTDHVVDVVTFDNYTVRIKTMSIAERRIQSSQEEGMRHIIGVPLVEMASNMTLSEIVKAVISGDLAKDIAKACRVVIPIKRIEIRKTEVHKVGDGEPESIIEEKPEPAPAPVSDDDGDDDAVDADVTKEAAEKELEAGLQEMDGEEAAILARSQDEVITQTAEKELNEGLDEMVESAKPSDANNDPEDDEVDEDVTKEAAEKELEAGLQEMDGEEAAILARSQDEVITQAAEEELEEGLEEMTDKE